MIKGVLGKNYLYNKYTAFHIIKINTTKKRRYIFSVSTLDIQLFDISINKTREISVKITFKTINLQEKEA